VPPILPARADEVLKRWATFTRFLDNGPICLTINAAELNPDLIDPLA
jgi:hypothetical protein